MVIQATRLSPPKECTGVHDLHNQHVKTTIPSMASRVLSHTADTGIEVTADSLADLIGELCAGMFGLMASVEPSAAEKWVEVSLVAQTVEELVVNTLSELVYHSEVENLIFCAFRVWMGPDLAVRVKAGGLLVDAVEPVGPPIKAVTYHDLVVEQRDDIWYGRVYFDV